MFITTGRVQHRDAWKEAGWLPLDIAVKSAQGRARTLAPTWGMVTLYKRGFLSAPGYATQYAEILRSSRESYPGWWNTVLSREKVVFLCYCPVGDFCHRHLAAQEFVRYGQEELGGLNVVLVPEDGRIPPEGS